MATATSAGSFQFPVAVSDITPTSHEAMDAAIATLQASKDAWVKVSVQERIALLDRLIRDFRHIAPRWVNACLRAKGIAPDAYTAGEEWGTGPYTLIRNLRLLRESLTDIAKHGVPRVPGPISTRPDGQVVAGVFPTSSYDKVLFTGLTAEIWMEPGVTIAELPNTQALAYRDKDHPGKVALVLGAGNVSSIGPADAFYKLFVEDQIVIFKCNPVNAYLGPLMEECFRALIEPGYLRIVYGGAAEGGYLCQHAGVEEIHITGSDKTFDAIVFGMGPEGAARKAAGTPVLNKRVTGELGNVSPVIVVPGPWGEGDIAYHAAHLASMLTNNAGFNCNATRMIVQHAEWTQRDQLLGKMREILRATPTRVAYYPGARERHEAFLAAHPEAEELGAPSGEELPWTLISGVAPEQTEDIVFTTEAFCSLFAETALSARSTADFIEQAVAFCNKHVWGSLNATLIVHPRSMRDAGVRAAVERAIANLRYGSVGLNYWGGTSFVLGSTTWGAFPGHSLGDIQSGTGIVHNTLMFSRPQKSVLRAPFKTTPTPPWFVTRGRAGLNVFKRLAAFEAAPSPAKLPAIIAAALRG